MAPDDIRQPCRALKAAAPAEWNDFVDMFTRYTTESLEALCSAPDSELAIQRGRAQTAKGLLSLFLEADHPVRLVSKR